MRPATYALSLYRGDSYGWQFRVWQDDAKTQPADLTDVIVKAQIRDKAGGSQSMDLGCVVTLPNLIDVTLPASAWIDGVDGSSGAWDLQATYSNGVVITLVAGLVQIVTDVTT